MSPRAHWSTVLTTSCTKASPCAAGPAWLSLDTGFPNVRPLTRRRPPVSPALLGPAGFLGRGGCGGGCIGGVTEPGPASPFPCSSRTSLLPSALRLRAFRRAAAFWPPSNLPQFHANLWPKVIGPFASPQFGPIDARKRRILSPARSPTPMAFHLEERPQLLGCRGDAGFKLQRACPYKLPPKNFLIRGLWPYPSGHGKSAASGATRFPKSQSPMSRI